MTDTIIIILNDVQNQRSNLFYTNPRRPDRGFLIEKDIQEKAVANMWLNNDVWLNIYNIWLKIKINGCRCSL